MGLHTGQQIVSGMAAKSHTGQQIVRGIKAAGSHTGAADGEGDHDGGGVTFRDGGW